MFIEVITDSGVELNWTIAALLLSVLFNVFQMGIGYVMKTQTAKDKVQDKEVEDLKLRVTTLEKEMNNKLDDIKSGIADLTSSINVSIEKAHHMALEVDTHTRKIEDIQEKITRIKQRISDIEGGMKVDAT